MDCENNNVIPLEDRKPPELANGKVFHVFISYATTDPDRQIAANLYTKLTGMDYQCCLHEIDFKAGHMIQDNIDKSVKQSLKTIILLSHNFTLSYWCSIEMTTIVGLHMENRGFPPIIVKLDNCDVPEALRPYTYISVEKDLDCKIAEISCAINDVEIIEFPGWMPSISFVPLPCINYNQEIPHSPCIWPHICAKHILADDACDGKCERGHMISSESLEKLKKCGFPTERSPKFLMQVYKEKCKQWLKEFPTKTISGPCFYYNDKHKGCYSAPDTCPFTHICKDWFVGNCSDNNCPFSHDVSNPQTARLLHKFGINTNQPDDIILWQYREKCPNYVELKTKTKLRQAINPLAKLVKFILYLTLTFMSTDLCMNKFDSLIK